jgi:two-component system, chemotaxis family, CheB/CheR fusion protein
VSARDLSNKVNPDSPAPEEQDYSVRLALLASIVECSDDAIVSKTLEGQIQSWNGGAARLFGYSAEEAIGQPITIIIPPELHEQERRILDSVRHGEQVNHFDTVRLTKDGRRIPISLTVSPIRDSRGTIVGASKIARDISERKRLEEMSRQNEEALRDADRRKDEFLALLAHELRNPLAPIRYALAANQKCRTVEQLKRSEEIIERQVAHMGRLLDDLLDVSRVTRDSLELKKAPTELTSVVGSAIETARPILDAKRHTLSVDLPKQALRLEADSVRLGQIFSNLLINAAKYTDPGGHIQLYAFRDGTDVVVSIRDNGIGISEEMMPRIFTMYSQAQGALGRSEGGLGIGLSLVRGLVSLHGGHIEARSDGAGKGSEFVLRLPIGIPVGGPEDGDTSDHANRSGGGLKLLVVDDNRDAADSCTSLMELCGHHVRTAYSGQQALELAEAFRPHALLLDIGLPDIDGYQLAAKIREAPWGRHAVLIALTGWGQEQDRRRAMEAGCDYHLTKPVEPESVDSLLKSLGPFHGAPGSAR